MNKEFFETVGMITALGVFVFALWINLVAEPHCESKGFAGVDRGGCYIIKNGERIHESNPNSN